MKLIHGDRQSGKTLAAIREAAAVGAYLVVRSHKEALRIVRLAERDGLSIRFPLTFDEFTEGAFSVGGVRSFIIDGADALLNRFARGAPIHLATFDTTPARGPQAEKGERE